ncbi:MAG: ABC transporter permease [Phycisphaerales bacterium]
MYHALLTRTYLTTKVIPLLATLAVMFCTSMVLITWSVMGGFLTMLLSKGQTLIGDVSIHWPNAGFAYYDDLVSRLEKETAVVGAATAMIEGPAMVELADRRRELIQVRGIMGGKGPGSYSRVVDFENTLWWREIDRPLRKDLLGQDPRLCTLAPADVEAGMQRGFPLLGMLLSSGQVGSESIRTALRSADAAFVRSSIENSNRERLRLAMSDALSMTALDPETRKRGPAVVPGIELLGHSQRQVEGFYSINTSAFANPDGSVGTLRQFALDRRVLVRVFPVDRKGNPTSQTVSQIFPVANEYRTEVYDFDRRTMLMDLATLQSMLHMDETVATSQVGPSAVQVGENGEETFNEPPKTGRDPARVTTVLVRAAPGVSAEVLRERCVEVYAGFARDYDGKVPDLATMVRSGLIQTWAQRNAQLVGAVQHETVLVLGMLVFISFCCTFLILAIFWAMVAEKTRDIGILRSIGASRLGVAWLWLRYGAIIGLLGAGLGFAVSYSIITNINDIHDWLGARFGIAVWDPKVYYFSSIPSVIEPSRAVVVLAGGVVFSILGALIPALRAATMHPVKALRFE